jgi:hypothetical protein
MYYRPEIQGDTDEYGLVFAVGILLGVEGARTEVNHLGKNIRCTVKYRPPGALYCYCFRKGSGLSGGTGEWKCLPPRSG